MYTKQQAYAEIIGKKVWYLDYSKKALLHEYYKFHEKHPEIAIPLGLEDVFLKGTVLAVENRLAVLNNNKEKVFVGDLVPVEGLCKKELQKLMWKVFIEARKSLEYHGRDNGFLSMLHIFGVLENNE